uniref:Uncharacterized protein n=1 Tax=Leptobrachium leishanense TaxID=445787 RepID=A0A8C5PYY1_9ANUR
MGPKQVNPKRSYSLSASTSNDESPSSSSSAPALPGFYYDPEKNRYFRLLPGHNNWNPLTNEMLQQKEKELARQKMLKEEENRRAKPVRPGLNATKLLLKRNLGMAPLTTYCRRIHELKVGSMMGKRVPIQSTEPTESRAQPYNLMVADSKYEKVFTANEVESSSGIFGILSLAGLTKDPPAVKAYYNSNFSNPKVIAACWAYLNSADSHILVCQQDNLGTPGCVGLLPTKLFWNLEEDPDYNDELPELFYNMKISNLWSCSWYDNPYREGIFSIGLDNQFMIINANRNFKTKFMTDSAVLAQQFSSKTALLVNGCRSGAIFAVDLRRPSRPTTWRKAFGFEHDSSISSMHMLQDENYLMASDMSGKIKLWDIRILSPVKHYEGHKNSYARLPVHVNEDEGLLIAVGQDCYTRIWSLDSTDLLRTIPSPHPAGNDSVPKVVFSSYLGGRNQSIPGLLMAVKKDLYHFTYNPDTLKTKQ